MWGTGAWASTVNVFSTQWTMTMWLWGCFLTFSGTGNRGVWFRVFLLMELVWFSYIVAERFFGPLCSGDALFTAGSSYVVGRTPSRLTDFIVIRSCGGGKIDDVRMSGEGQRRGGILALQLYTAYGSDFPSSEGQGGPRRKTGNSLVFLQFAGYSLSAPGRI